MNGSPAWPDYEKLVFQWAHSYVKKCPAAQLEDLVAEGRVAFCEALTTWKPEKGKFSTHLVWQIRNRMSQWIEKEMRFARSVREAVDEASLHAPTRNGVSRLGEVRGDKHDANPPVIEPATQPTFLERLFQEIGDDAKRLVELLLHEQRLPLGNGTRKATQEIRTALRTLKYT